MARLKGKSCFVTAAGQGIGKASALAMRREGAEVFATDLRSDGLAELAAVGIRTAPLDVRDPAAVSAAIANAGAIDVLFNCAGYVAHGTILDCSETEWAASIEVNMTSMFRVVRAALPGMLARGGGSIVNMSSVASSVIAASDRFVYGTTKAAVVGMTKSIAADFVARGIRCNAICPGTVESPSLQERMRARGDYETARAAFVARQPLGRIGRPEEIAALVVYLASDESAYTTGALHVIDGGWSNV